MGECQKYNKHLLPFRALKKNYRNVYVEEKLVGRNYKILLYLAVQLK
jgi:ATP-dependent RNA circularization protein (DNA/RNA ligase family)